MTNEKKPLKKTEHLDKDEARRAKEEQARRNRRRMRQLIGLALSVLVVVGAVSIVRSGINVAKNLMDDSSETEAYNRRILPLVWFDVLPFESLAEADPNAIKQAVIWGVLNELGKTVEYDDLGQPLVPAVEVDRFAAQLFGPDYKLEHGSFNDPVQNLSYTYDPATNMYAATATGLTPLYTSTVVAIERLPGGIKKVTAGYVSTLNSNDELIATPDLSHPSKYMDYFFRRDGNEYYLYALRNNTSYTPESQSAVSGSNAATSASAPVSASLDGAGDSGLNGQPGSASAASGSASLAQYDDASSQAVQQTAAEESSSSSSAA